MTQPKASILLAVFADGERPIPIPRGFNNEKSLVVVAESRLVEALSGRNYTSVWLSKGLGLACKGKIPRGVEVYCER